MKNITPIILSICILINSTSCITLFTTKNQTVLINSKETDSKIFIEDESVGSGNIEVKLKRDMAMKSIKITKPDYKTKNDVLYQSRRNLLVIGDYVALFPYLLPGAISLVIDGVGKKWKSYEKFYAFEPLEKIPLKQENQKYLFVKETSLKIKEGDEIGKYYHKKYKKIREGSSILCEEDVTYENTIFTDDLNELLVNYNYRDTIKRIIPNNVNSLFMNASINKINISHVNTTSSGSFYSLVIDMDWQFLDAYSTELLTTSTSVKSDRFSVENEIKDVIYDALDYSLINLLKKETVKSLLVKDKMENLNTNKETISIKKPKPNGNIGESVKSSVTILTENGHGSGFLISNDGYIITNHHVTAGFDEFDVILSNGEKIKGTAIRNDPIHDLSLIQIEGKNYNPLLIDTEKDILLGNSVFAIGTPKDIELGQTVSKGIISGEFNSEGNKYIQTDASVNSGNSGGPLINKDGLVLGVVNAKIFGFGVEGIAFAIPSHYIFSELNLKYK